MCGPSAAAGCAGRPSRARARGARARAHLHAPDAEVVRGKQGRFLLGRRRRLRCRGGTGGRRAVRMGTHGTQVLAARYSPVRETRRLARGWGGRRRQHRAGDSIGAAAAGAWGGRECVGARECLGCSGSRHATARGSRLAGRALASDSGPQLVQLLRSWHVASTRCWIAHLLSALQAARLPLHGESAGL